MALQSLPVYINAGLRDLVDYLPASLATIISYFSAEITRGIWKPVSMNGTDWPSPAANLLLIESEVKEILTSAGVHVPSFHAGMRVCSLGFVFLYGLIYTKCMPSE